MLADQEATSLMTLISKCFPKIQEPWTLTATLRQRSIPKCRGLHLWLSDDFEQTWRWIENRYACSCAPPYWATAWPGGQAVARFIMENPSWVAGRRVLDLGSGGGICAVAAAMSGAALVQASDIDPLACEATILNAQANRTQVRVVCEDPTAGLEGSFDLIVAADLWYEKFAARRITGWLRAQLSASTVVLAGDSGRAFFPRDRFKSLAQYEIQSQAQLEPASSVCASVYTMPE